MPQIESKPSPESIFSLCLQAGALMLSSGAETSRVEETITRMAAACGAAETHTFATPTGIFITVCIEGEVSTRVVRIASRVNVNLRTVTRINEISRRMERGQYTLEESLRELELLIQKPLVYPNWVLYIAAFLSAGGFTILFGGAPMDFLWGGISGLAADRVSSEIGKQVPKFLADFFGSSVGCLLVEGVSLIPHSYSSHLEAAMIGAIVPLVPGLAITNSVRDLMAGELLSGVARAAEAVFTSIAISTAVALVLSLRL